MPFLEKVVIRQAIIEDAEAIASIHVQCWQQSYKGHIEQSYLDNLPQTLPNRISRWNQTIISNTNTSLIEVALYDGNIIGFCSCGAAREESNSKGEIYAIYLLDEYKGKGLGNLLWQNAERHLRKEHLIPFELTALASNHTARKFYEKQGGSIASMPKSKIGEKEYEEVKYIF